MFAEDRASSLGVTSSCQRDLSIGARARPVSAAALCLGCDPAPALPAVVWRDPRAPFSGCFFVIVWKPFVFKACIVRACTTVGACSKVSLGLMASGRKFTDLCAFYQKVRSCSVHHYYLVYSKLAVGMFRTMDNSTANTLKLLHLHGRLGLSRTLVYTSRHMTHTILLYCTVPGKRFRYLLTVRLRQDFRLMTCSLQGASFKLPQMLPVRSIRGTSCSEYTLSRVFRTAHTGRIAAPMDEILQLHVLSV